MALRDRLRVPKTSKSLEERFTKPKHEVSPEGMWQMLSQMAEELMDRRIATMEHKLQGALDRMLRHLEDMEAMKSQYQREGR